MASDGDPTISVIDLQDPDASARIDEACRDTGFLVVTNHGVDQSVIDAAWAATTRFFDLPIADKMSVAMPYRGYPYGYAPLQGERLAASLGDETPPDLKETFSMGPIDRPVRGDMDPAEAFVYEPTPWPSTLPELQPALEAYYEAMADLVARVMTLFAEALALPPDYFDSRIDRHTERAAVVELPGVARTCRARPTPRRCPHRLWHRHRAARRRRARVVWKSSYRRPTAGAGPQCPRPPR